MSNTADRADVQRGTPKVQKTWSREKWVEVYSEKGTVTATCKVIGISRQTAYKARKFEPDFAAAWDREEQAVTDHLEKTLIEIALEGSGSPQIRALMFALRARRPTVYRENIRLEHGGKIGVETEAKVDDELNAAIGEIQRLTDRLAEVAPGGQAALPGGGASEPMAPASEPGSASPA